MRHLLANAIRGAREAAGSERPLVQTIDRNRVAGLFGQNREREIRHGVRARAVPRPAALSICCRCGPLLAAPPFLFDGNPHWERNDGMGVLVDGMWKDDLVDSRTGRFVRAPTTFRNWVTPDGGPGPSGRGGFAAEP